MAIELLTESTFVALTSRDPVAAALIDGKVRYSRDTVVLTDIRNRRMLRLCHTRRRAGHRV